MIPQRVQRKRVRGWKKPDNTVIVDRSSKWGNPYGWNGEPKLIQVGSREEAISEFRKYILESPLVFLIPALKGKNLACTCKLNEPCHSDVLLELANQ